MRRAGLSFLLLVVLSLGALVQGGLVGAQEGTRDLTFFRIGTGSPSGTYFPVGGLLASVITNPPGSRECERGGSCGVSNLIAVAESSEGSIDNVRAINAGLLDSGFAQADIAYWAYSGQGIFQSDQRLTNLRTIANLFPEVMHVVVRADSRVLRLSDLAGLRVSLDREGSGTRIDALTVLAAHGLTLGDIIPYSLSSGAAADALRAGEIDAFFMIAGTPAAAVASLASESLIRLIPLDQAVAAELAASQPFFSSVTIPSGTYFNVASTPSLAVGAQWLVSADLPEQTVYEITRALWHPNARLILTSGHPKGREIVIERALDGLVVPLHPGARRFYSEAGIDAPLQ